MPACLHQNFEGNLKEHLFGLKKDWKQGKRRSKTGSTKKFLQVSFQQLAWHQIHACNFFCSFQSGAVEQVLSVRFKKLCVSHVGILSWGNLRHTTSYIDFSVLGVMLTSALFYDAEFKVLVGLKTTNLFTVCKIDLFLLRPSYQITPPCKKRKKCWLSLAYILTRFEGC